MTDRASDLEWSDYVWNRNGSPGIKREWWCHVPSGYWFMLDRDTASDEILRRFVTVPEGMPSIMVYDRLMANPSLTGTIEVPPEGSVLPDTYEIEKGESRQAV